MSASPWLDNATFRGIVDTTPLVSIDLVVRNMHNQILLGKRLNRPAEGFWFVPGGRIRKNESLAAAFERLTKNELGTVFSASRARYIGLFEHFYNDSVFGEQPDTHYVVNGFELMVSEPLILPKEQHNEYQWLYEDELLGSDSVHLHSKWYFQQDKGFRI
ncbi:GDP-mannose mannosyl hydrolase [Oceanobacter mangrovi]|uniref:GDP-mannose mannosyl hydrolase n=1 Tax=Oceanobacter mangrovi TaxID=2862510 RepID=UPI001C8E736E|nr:GDP-mannose mannosyl hydrolase [Oceanobacter mangrovi]